MPPNLSEELNAKYLLVKEDVLAGMRVHKALKKHGLDHGSYYGRRANDPEPIKKVTSDWSRKAKHPKVKATKPSTSFVIPLAQNTAPSPKTAPSSTGKIAVIVCEADQLNNILQGLGR